MIFCVALLAVVALVPVFDVASPQVLTYSTLYSATDDGSLLLVIAYADLPACAVSADAPLPTAFCLLQTDYAEVFTEGGRAQLTAVPIDFTLGATEFLLMRGTATHSWLPSCQDTLSPLSCVAIQRRLYVSL